MPARVHVSNVQQFAERLGLMIQRIEALERMSGRGGGGGAVDTLWVGPTAPSDPAIELWWNTTTQLLYVQTAPGVWTPTGGGETVIIPGSVRAGEVIGVDATNSPAGVETTIKTVNTPAFGMPGMLQVWGVYAASGTADTRVTGRIRINGTDVAQSRGLRDSGSATLPSLVLVGSMAITGVAPVAITITSNPITNALTFTNSPASRLQWVFVPDLATQTDWGALDSRYVNAPLVLPSPVVRTYSANATWTKPANLWYVVAEVQGGGGAGGGAPASTAGNVSWGAGGGGGGWARKLFAAAALGATEAVVVGAGGDGVSGAAGNPGAASSFAGVIGNGGSGGGNAVAAATSGTARAILIGGNGGSASVPPTSDAFGNGGRGEDIYHQPGGSIGASKGGSSGQGGGGASIVLDGNGAASSTRGGGGGGMRNNGAQAARVGGGGGDGIVTVTEFYLPAST